MKNRLLLTITISLFIITISFISCQSFSHIWINDLPIECNMSLNAMRLYYNSKDKSATVPSLTACYKKIHRLFCQGEVFGFNKAGKPNPVNYQDSVKYRNYEQCKSELK